ncbi:integrase [Bradyrhizobium sp. Leo121]|uniref:tyrosine-type recombinase/integrase n=1 Tax=Bradyrhizobium sp. Leo121 TaxID=1571195 RepID=UPI001029231F|nr:integrase [Bradyrhizobium sp. Leo121]RZN19509.1 integrase [Bradyrhizobium sp. Leo121]
MVVKVPLDGLNIVKARGRWYVYPRGGGEPLVKGFEGSRKDLLKKLAEPELLQTYNRPRLLKRLASEFPIETLGGFVNWYTNSDIDRPLKECLPAPGKIAAGYPKWPKLSAATRQDYLEAFEYLRPEFDAILKDITQPELYDVRDKCANKKWPRFADQMIAALSSMFRQAVKRGKMPFNPCLGMDKAHAADPNSNREWFAPEWQFVRDNAPMEVLIPCMVARYAGLAGQTIVGITDKQFLDHPLTGKAVQYTRRKNGKTTFLPVLPELQAFLAARDIRRADGLIAIRDDGSPWESEKDMQTRVSHWLRDRERDGLIGAGTTLHGLRVSYAAWWKRMGASDDEVARLIGDKSPRMGTHYTRHVEDEVSIVRAFGRLKDKP